MPSIYRRTKPTIGVLTGWQFYRTATNLSYLAPIFRGITKAAQTLGCNLLLGCGIGPSASPADPLRPVWPVPSPDQDFAPIGPFNTDGLIVAVPLHSEARSDYVQDLRRLGYPILFVGSGEIGPTIVANNSDGIFAAMKHLVEHKHKEIAFIAGTVNDMRGDSGDRLRAYQSACKAFSLNENPLLVAYGRHVFDGGYLAMEQIINSGVSFTAVLASNDESALGAIQALKKYGYQIPRDVAVIGFDNRLEGVVEEPNLTTIHVSLFNMGYHAVELMMHHLEGVSELPPIVKVDTYLVVRNSCGCGDISNLSDEPNLGGAQPQSEISSPTSRLVQTLAKSIMHQAHSITEMEGLAFCEQLVSSFKSSIEMRDPHPFNVSLMTILEHTAKGDDDTHIWQHQLTILANAFLEILPEKPLSRNFANELINNARLSISAFMRHQHRRYVVDERWTSSRLSLLTARLLTALDEQQIFEILATHLPDLGINTAMIGFFEPAGDDPVAWCTMRNTINLDQEPVRFLSRDFPPVALFDDNSPFILTLVPLVDQTGQLGFTAFRSDHFDLYGAIVQQLGGAFNTARLYRQATEGRRLAEEANRMKSRFLSTISHELRTPLNLILGLSGMVMRENDEGEVILAETTYRDIERIHAYSQHLGGLIGDVIDLATNDAGQLRLNNEYLDLSNILRVVIESGNQLAMDKGLMWEAKLPPSGPWVWGDPMRLRQVVLNLVNNAIKFTSVGGVYLELEDLGNSVSVSIRDTGLGIPVEDQQSIFDEFRQSERSIERGYGGLGLGLAISKRLIEMHGGKISVASSGIEGQGATFTFTLPTTQPPTIRIPEEVVSSPNKQPIVILAYDSNSSSLLYERLNQQDYHVHTILTHSTDWRAEVQALNPVAIILDVSKNSVFGWETLNEIKRNPFMVDIPLFFFSSTHPNGSLLQLDYLIKPIEISALDRHWLLSNAGGHSQTVLIVEDEPNTLEMHVRTIRAHSSSNRILRAYNGKEALAILRRETVDLILLDLQMPEMDGFEVLEAMRNMDAARKIPVIVMTGRALNETDMTRLNQSVSTILEKGLFSIEETVNHITIALEHKRRLSGETQRLVRLAMAYIHEHYVEKLTRKEVAQYVAITEDHLTFCFRQELGITPIAYVQRFRINQAKQLLRETQQNITEIAMRVGFTDSGYFSRIFHRETGMSPEAFRRS